MSDLAAFLLARIAEDEAAAPSEHFKGDPEDVYYWCAGARVPGDPAIGDLEAGEQFCDCHLAPRRRRALAECEAKRRIVEWSLEEPGRVGPALAILAQIYSGHPDFDSSWGL